MTRILRFLFLFFESSTNPQAVCHDRTDGFSIFWSRILTTLYQFDRIWFKAVVNVLPLVFEDISDKANRQTSPVFGTDPPENCHLTVKKLQKKTSFFQKKLPKFAKNEHFCQFFLKKCRIFCIFLCHIWKYICSNLPTHNLDIFGELLFQLIGNL